MKERRQIIFLTTLVISLVISIIWFSNRNKNSPPSEAQGPLAKDTAPVTPPITIPTNVIGDPIQALLQKPFVFYGRVLDQDGLSIPGVEINAEIANNSLKASPRSIVSDAQGKFTIRSRGMSLHIEVAKNGYYKVDPGGQLKPSSQGFYFVEGIGSTVYSPDPSSPAVFNLRKSGNPVALENLKGQTKVPRDGTRILVNLSKISDATIQIACKTNDNSAAQNVPYDWHCEISVPTGGIQAVTDDQLFVAPDHGYTSFVAIDMPKTLGPQEWSSDVRVGYWIKFSDGTFGKINFRMIAGGDHFAVIGGFRNPMPQDRNLEPQHESR